MTLTCFSEVGLVSLIRLLTTLSKNLLFTDSLMLPLPSLDNLVTHSSSTLQIFNVLKFFNIGNLCSIIVVMTSLISEIIIYPIVLLFVASPIVHSLPGLSNILLSKNTVPCTSTSTSISIISALNMVYSSSGRLLSVICDLSISNSNS